MILSVSLHDHFSAHKNNAVTKPRIAMKPILAAILVSVYSVDESGGPANMLVIA